MLLESAVRGPRRRQQRHGATPAHPSASSRRLVVPGRGRAPCWHRYSVITYVHTYVRYICTCPAFVCVDRLLDAFDFESSAPSSPGSVPRLDGVAETIRWRRLHNGLVSFLCLQPSGFISWPPRPRQLTSIGNTQITSTYIAGSAPCFTPTIHLTPHSLLEGVCLFKLVHCRSTRGTYVNENKSCSMLNTNSFLSFSKLPAAQIRMYEDFRSIYHIVEVRAINDGVPRYR